MKFTLTRYHFADTFTIGGLYANDSFICYVLEDKVREQEGVPVAEWKVQNETAIPKGTYPLSVTYSNRFKTMMPLLSNVDGFTGIRIHTGNTSKNTEGCLIVGSSWDGRSDWVGGSKIAYERLLPMIQSAKDPVITIE